MIVGLVIVIVLFFLLRPKEEPEEDILWREYKVEKGDITASFDSTGTVQYKEDLYSFPKVLIIDKIHVKVGQHVSKGEILISYSRDKPKEQLEELQLAYDKAFNAVQDAKNNRDLQNTQYVNEKQNAMQESENKFQTAKSTLENTIAGLIEQVQSMEQEKSDLQAQEDELQTEKIQAIEKEITALNLTLSQKKNELSQLTSSRETEIQEQQSQWSGKEQENNLSLETLDNAIQNAQAEADKAKTDVDKMKALLETPDLVSKEEGIVTAINFKEGQEVPQGQSVITVGNGSNIIVKVPVAQEDIHKVMTDQKVELLFAAFQDLTFKGKVVEKSYMPAEGKDGVKYDVKIQLDKTEQELLNGMTCNVNFIQKQVTDVLTLSNKAIEQSKGKQTVTVKLPDGTMEKRTIETGFSDGRRSEVTDGLTVGELVVKKG